MKYIIDRSVVLFFILPVVFIFQSELIAQNVYISKYIPGDYLYNNSHVVRIYNPHESAVDISSYLLVTRDYAIRLPQGMVVRPHSGLSFAKEKNTTNRANVIFSDLQDFWVIVRSRKQIGNYIVLFDQEMKKIDGMYFSPSENVSFLPDKNYCRTSDDKKIPFNVPAESDPFWERKNIVMNEDPAVGYIQFNGNWLATSINSNLIPSTRYATFSALNFEGIITLKWKTDFEDNCRIHLVEKSISGQAFKTIAEVDGAITSQQPVEYEFYDEEVAQNQRYIYKITNVDVFGNVIETEPIEVVTVEEKKDFSFDVFWAQVGGRKELNITYSSQNAGNIKIKMLDDRCREVALLYEGELQRDQQNLIKVAKKFQPAKYLVYATLDDRRIFREIKIEE